MCLILGLVEGNWHRMESRKLGNKTKIIKLMYKVGNYGLIFITMGRETSFGY